VAAAGCGGSTVAATTAIPRAHASRFAEVAAAFARHGETIALEPDLTGDDIWLAFGHTDLPRPLAVLTRADGNTAVYVFRSYADAAAVEALPRRELVFRARWRVLHGSNLLVITVRDTRPVVAALADLGH
jgi:hypothetical protein